MLDHLSHALYSFPVFGLVGLRDRPVRPVAVDDVARILEAAATGDERLRNRTVAVLGPEELTLGDAVRRVADAIGRRPVYVRLPVVAHLALAHACEAVMRVPLISVAQVHILAEGVVEAAPPAADELPPDLVPRTPFTAEVIRRGLPEPGPVRLPGPPVVAGVTVIDLTTVIDACSGGTAVDGWRPATRRSSARRRRREREQGGAAARGVDATAVLLPASRTVRDDANCDRRRLRPHRHRPQSRPVGRRRRGRHPHARHRRDDIPAGGPSGHLGSRPIRGLDDRARGRPWGDQPRRRIDRPLALDAEVASGRSARAASPRRARWSRRSPPLRRIDARPSSSTPRGPTSTKGETRRRRARTRRRATRSSPASVSTGRRRPARRKRSASASSSCARAR